jgi:sterol desaturase/sphingolipid hydroxylase (fatty acid hydroxylase superfamily)
MIIIPCLHRTHHSARRVEENSNYGIVFSVWDRAFGTIKEVVPEAVGLRNVRDQNFLELLKFGFTTEQKEYKAIGSSSAVEVRLNFAMNKL